jgi:Leucine-rich repeat (LRR) protein
MLELSANKIERIENLADFPKLQQLYMNKNKIPRIENLAPVSHIKLLGLSVGCLMLTLGQPDHQDRELGVAGRPGRAILGRE